MTTNIQFKFPKARFDAMTAALYDATPLAEMPSSLLIGAGAGKRLAVKWNLDRLQTQDAAEVAYIVRSLEQIRAGVQETEYPGLNASDWFPFTQDVDPGKESLTITKGDRAGKPEYTKNLKGDAPRVDFDLDQVSYPMASFWLSYGYGIQDVRAARAAGVPLLPHYAMLCREEMARLLDDIAFNGHTNAGLKGIFTLSGVDTYSVPADGVGGSKAFTAKDPDKVLRDLNAPASQVIVATKGIENPDSVLMPISTHEHIAGRRVGDGTNESILSYWKRTTPHITNIYRSHKGETKGGSSDTRMVTYQKRVDKLEMPNAVIYEQFAPGVSANGLEVVTVAHMRTGGMITHRPKSICNSDGQ